MKTPTFDEWLNKYFKDPRTVIIYKSTFDTKEYKYTDLVKRYERAFKTFTR